MYALLYHLYGGWQFRYSFRRWLSDKGFAIVCLCRDSTGQTHCVCAATPFHYWEACPDDATQAWLVRNKPPLRWIYERISDRFCNRPFRGFLSRKAKPIDEDPRKPPTYKGPGSTQVGNSPP